MARSLTVGSDTFNYPEQGTSPSWGNDAADWAEAVTDVLNTLCSDTDIVNSSFTLLASQTGANITGLSFDPSAVRSAVIEYAAFCSSTTDKTETGTLRVSYTGSGFNMSRQSDNDVGLTFSIDSSGQVKYTSGSSSAGTLKFRARTFAQ